MEVVNHSHTGIDSPKIDQKNIFNAIDGSTVVYLTGNQAISGIKTFTSIPILPSSDPTSDNQAVRKSYVDDLLDFSYTINISDNIVDSADTERSSTVASNIKKKEIEYNETDGTITVSFEMKSLNGQSVSSAIYVNGSMVGTLRSTTSSIYVKYEEDFDVDTDDLIQLYVNADGAGRTVYIKNFRLKYARWITPTAGSVNTD